MAQARAVRTPQGVELVLATARADDRTALFAMFADVVESADGFPHEPPLADDDFEAVWGRVPSLVVVARAEGRAVGAYYLKPNFPGRAAHIANAGYMVERGRRRRGIGRALVEDSLVEARHLGFDSMQFNLVFASNPARRLYEELGFEQVGRVPGAVAGEEALVYFRTLEPPPAHHP